MLSKYQVTAAAAAPSVLHSTASLSRERVARPRLLDLYASDTRNDALDVAVFFKPELEAARVLDDLCYVCQERLGDASGNAEYFAAAVGDDALFPYLPYASFVRRRVIYDDEPARDLVQAPCNGGRAFDVLHTECVLVYAFTTFLDENQRLRECLTRSTTTRDTLRFDRMLPESLVWSMMLRIQQDTSSSSSERRVRVSTTYRQQLARQAQLDDHQWAVQALVWFDARVEAARANRREPPGLAERDYALRRRALVDPPPLTVDAVVELIKSDEYEQIAAFAMSSDDATNVVAQGVVRALDASLSVTDVFETITDWEKKRILIEAFIDSFRFQENSAQEVIQRYITTWVGDDETTDILQMDADRLIGVFLSVVTRREFNATDGVLFAFAVFKNTLLLRMAPDELMPLISLALPEMLLRVEDFVDVWNENTSSEKRSHLNVNMQSLVFNGSSGLLMPTKAIFEVSTEAELSWLLDAGANVQPLRTAWRGMRLDKEPLEHLVSELQKTPGSQVLPMIRLLVERGGATADDEVVLGAALRAGRELDVVEYLVDEAGAPITERAFSALFYSRRVVPDVVQFIIRRMPASVRAAVFDKAFVVGDADNRLAALFAGIERRQLARDFFDAYTRAADASRSHERIVRALWARSAVAKGEVPDGYTGTLLHVAAAANRTDDVRWLKRELARDWLDVDGVEPVDYAIRAAALDAMFALIDTDGHATAALERAALEYARFDDVVPALVRDGRARVSPAIVAAAFAARSLPALRALVARDDVRDSLSATQLALFRMLDAAERLRSPRLIDAAERNIRDIDRASVWRALAAAARDSDEFDIDVFVRAAAYVALVDNEYATAAALARRVARGGSALEAVYARFTELRRANALDEATPSVSPANAINRFAAHIDDDYRAQPSDFSSNESLVRAVYTRAALPLARRRHPDASDDTNAVLLMLIDADDASAMTPKRQRTRVRAGGQRASILPKHGVTAAFRALAIDDE